ncbi:DUF6551 family protein [Xanthobacter aminoxidans]|uniref:ParB/RepB/Spo0J family partition protein n=1 Tax=Xanthobacter aminoxidans TaxID=186280 RepID=A0ABW6ZA38_9HYPH
MLNALSTAKFSALKSELNAGPVPMLQWIEVEKLVVDSGYQREMSTRGQSNVRRIAEGFDWSKFAPVIVAPVEGGRFAVVDGQHRTTAAMLRGFETVPCQVVQADRAKQAEAFAAVNGHVTKIQPQQIFYARLTAGDPQALAIAEVCAAAEVSISRKSLGRHRVRKGQTQSVAALQQCLDKFGRDTLITALQCITQTGDGNAGSVRGKIVEALCLVLTENPQWRDAGSALFEAMDDFDFIVTWDEVMVSATSHLCQPVVPEIADRIRKHLSRKFKPAKRAA